MNRFIKAMLKILANKPGRSTLDWPKFVCYVPFVYSSLSIPGTDVTSLACSVTQPNQGQPARNRTFSITSPIPFTPPHPTTI